jgi:hypothetical protein
MQDANNDKYKKTKRISLEQQQEQDPALWELQQVKKHGHEDKA